MRRCPSGLKSLFSLLRSGYMPTGSSIFSTRRGCIFSIAYSGEHSPSMCMSSLPLAMAALSDHCHLHEGNYLKDLRVLNRDLRRVAIIGWCI